MSVIQLMGYLENWVLFQDLLQTQMSEMKHLFSSDPNKSLWDKISGKKGLSFAKYVDSTFHARAVISVKVTVYPTDWKLMNSIELDIFTLFKGYKLFIPNTHLSIFFFVIEVQPTS